MMIARRSLLVHGAGALAAGMFAPRIALAAAPTEQRFVFIIQRGAADGLHIVPPLGDPGYAALRGPLLEGLAGAHRIDGTFALHPALQRVAALFDAKQAAAAHAVASIYRDRSHFDGQNVLETGGRQAYAERVGWMNRLVGALPISGSSGTALALAPEIPMALRGPAPVTSYAPTRLPQPGDDLLERVRGLYAGDPQLHGLWDAALATRALAGMDQAAGKSGAEMGKLAAQLLTPANGARIMMIETGGWDTHSAQAARLNTQLRSLDAMVGALVDGLGPLWRNTLVIVATEFGRTAAVNGTGGTDHGTAGAALLMGGSLARGGQVLADWPGLGRSALYENRDLQPTRLVEAVIAGALARLYDQDPQHLAARLYPDQPELKPRLD